LSIEDRLLVGCSGWSYKDWVGPFYNKEIQPKDYLKVYSRTFSCVEVDSSFYRIPNSLMVRHWKQSTPADFLFAPKMPKKISHENKLQDYEETLSYFYRMIEGLGEKLGPIVLQLPPSVKVSEHLSAIETLMTSFDPKFRHAIEFRHKSWFVPEVYNLLRKHDVALVWSINQYLETPSEITTDFIYLRFVGDREITQFNKIKKDRTSDMQRWAGIIKGKTDSYDKGFVFFNNHFAGFGPESVNEFRRLLGMIELDWSSDAGPGQGQKTLFGF
jgi:uncharacterized protein YecE (DUF72 family)